MAKKIWLLDGGGGSNGHFVLVSRLWRRFQKITKKYILTVLSGISSQPNIAVRLFYKCSPAPTFPTASQSTSAAGKQLVGQLSDHGIITRQFAHVGSGRYFNLRNSLAQIPEPEPKLRPEK